MSVLNRSTEIQYYTRLPTATGMPTLATLRTAQPLNDITSKIVASYTKYYHKNIMFKSIVCLTNVH